MLGEDLEQRFAKLAQALIGIERQLKVCHDNYNNDFFNYIGQMWSTHID